MYNKLPNYILLDFEFLGLHRKIVLFVDIRWQCYLTLKLFIDTR